MENSINFNNATIWVWVLVLLQKFWSLTEDVEEVCEVEERGGDAHDSHGGGHLLAAPADVHVGDGRRAGAGEHRVVGQAGHAWDRKTVSQSSRDFSRVFADILPCYKDDFLGVKFDFWGIS